MGRVSHIVYNKLLCRRQGGSNRNIFEKPERNTIYKIISLHLLVIIAPKRFVRNGYTIFMLLNAPDNMCELHSLSEMLCKCIWKLLVSSFYSECFCLRCRNATRFHNRHSPQCI